MMPGGSQCDELPWRITAMRRLCEMVGQSMPADGEWERSPLPSTAQTVSTKAHNLAQSS